MQADLWSLVLAAGGSRRLGTPKQLLRIRGRTLLSRIINAAEAVTPGRVVVVLGADALRMRSLIRRHHPRAHSVDNSRWAQGMAGSLQVGLAVLPTRATAALLLLSDQPAVGEVSLHRLIRAWRRRPGRAAAAAYAGVVGVPAILPRTLWRDARRLSGDEGARKLLRMEEMPATAAHMPEAAWDIDTPEDLQRLPDGVRFARQGTVGRG
ncbi:MAG: nucleotidyltransferase family protein [Rhodospirillaceae bacterium]|nr:nucleotidyltransferase family protein [Rhodospirillaceae bacterium]